MATDPTPPSARPAGQDRESPSKLEQLERKEGALWLSAVLLMILLAATLALVVWPTIRALPRRLEALPIGLVILVALFGLYAWSKTREAAELRGLIRGIEQHSAVPPSEKQLDQLFDLVSRSQQGYRDLIDTFDDHLLAISLDGEIRAANRSFAEFVERPFADIIGHRLDEFLDDPGGATRGAAQKALPRFLERRHWSGVVRVRPKQSGAVRYFDCMVHAMVKDDQVTGLSVLARDITQEHESEARFTELFETLQEGVYFSTPEGKLQDANPALVRILGYDSKEELLGVPVDELYADPAQRAAELAELEQQGKLQSREISLRRKDGSIAFCLDTATVIRDPAGRVLRYQGTLVDTTQRRAIEKRLHQEQEFARRLVDSFPDLIVVLDTQGHYTFVSPRMKELLGYTPEQLLSQHLGERTHPEDRTAMLALYTDLISGKRNFGSIEYRTQHKQGDWRIFYASASPLFDEEGKIVGVIASARDVTELKQLERQLIQSEKLAAMGQMIAGVAHELNNPLTAILGVSELLQERASDDTTRRQLDLAHHQARRAAHIVQNLLAFSRPPAPHKTKLQLSELLQRTLQLHDHSLRANNITVDFLARLDLPAVVGDANQLMQVFLNLITNAEQAIREVRDRGTLRVRLNASGNYVRVSFEDDGAGVPREALPRLFDPFFTTKRPGRGTGLGLSICMAILREHGGSVEAQALPGGGSQFNVTLPIGDGPEGVAASPSLGARDAPADALKGRAVLVVDDEESIRELVQDGLSARGMIVDCAATGEQAFQLAAKRIYDIVLCDVNLTSPRAQGVSSQEIFQRLRCRADGPKPVFIFMTGDLVDPAALEGLAPDGSRVIQKPFRISDLVARLGEALGTCAPGQPPQRVTS